MRIVSRILLMLLVASPTARAQTSFRGASMQGTAMNSQVATEKENGAVAIYTADHGVGIAGVSNVFTWYDRTGNGYNLSMYQNTNQPFFVQSYTTNGFPAVVFCPTPTPNQQLKQDNLAALFTGNQKPFTFITLLCSQTNGICSAIGFGNFNSTNQNASGILIRPNPTTASNRQFNISTDTNAAVPSLSFAGGVGTNVYSYLTFTYDGTTGKTYQNITAGATASAMGGQVTLNTFTMGGWCRTNSNFVHPWFGGMTMFAVYTNALTGPQITNTVERWNGLFKAY